MAIQSSNDSSIEEKSKETMTSNPGDAIIDIDSRTTTLVSKDVEGKHSNMISLTITKVADFQSTTLVS
jgi:hypothetical protein